MSGRRRDGRERRGEASVPMAPLIDMVFLLLVFFMTASAMSSAGSRQPVDLPEAASSQVPQDLSKRFIVSIDSEGRYYQAGSLLEESELAERIAAERQRLPELKLALRADKTTPFQSVRAAMRIAAEHGVESYLYATYQSGL